MNILICAALLLNIQSTAVAKNAVTEVSNPPSEKADTSGSTLVRDSFDNEIEAGKKQLQESLPEDSAKSALPESGQVLTPSDKRNNSKEATNIGNHNSEDRVRIPSKKADGTPTIAIALGGGGARGAAHIGILRVLEANGIIPDYIVGNSMGAIVGGLYSAGVPLEKITTHLDDLSLRKAYMPCGIVKKIATIPLRKACHPFAPKQYAGLWTGEKLTEYLEQVLPQKNMEVQDTKIPFSSVATNLLDGKAYRITRGRLSTAIKASSAISPLIRPVPIDDKLYVDGGVRANLPASAARDTGAGFVIAILVDEPLQVLPAKQFLRLKNIASRLSDIVLAIADERQLQFADIVINPDVSSIPILSNEPQDVGRAVKAGELAALKALPILRQKLHLPDKSRTASD